MYNILIEFGITMKLVRLIKICQNESYSRVRVRKNLSDMFPLKNGLKQQDALSRHCFQLCFEYAIRRVQINWDGLKLNGTQQFLFYADGDNILAGSIHTIKRNIEALVVASIETGLVVNADKTEHVVMSGYQNAGQRHNTKNEIVP